GNEPRRAAHGRRSPPAGQRRRGGPRRQPQQVRVRARSRGHDARQGPAGSRALPHRLRLRSLHAD
ncbi:hypothetical protein AVDCRST_MAG82-2511, partial [uncultured Rubrobacteraceae bacterium]